MVKLQECNIGDGLSKVLTKISTLELQVEDSKKNIEKLMHKSKMLEAERLKLEAELLVLEDQNSALRENVEEKNEHITSDDSIISLSEDSYLSTYINDLLDELLQSAYSYLRLNNFYPKTSSSERCNEVSLSSANISDLPDEILLRIFSYLNVEDLCLNVARVCTHWRSVSRDNSLWRHVSINTNQRSNKYHLLTILRTCPLLHSLKIRGRSDVHELMSALSENCTELQELQLSFCNFEKKDEISLVSKIVNHYPMLKSLDLNGTQLYDPLSFCGLFELKNLTSLDLTHSKAMCGKWLSQIVSECSELTYLGLDDITLLRDRDIAYIAEKCNEKLEVLKLDGEDLTDESLISVSLCTRLKVFEMSFCDHMTDRGLLYGLANLTGLNVLKLRRGYQFTSQGLAAFLNRQELSLLMKLDLSECSELSDEALYNICARCKNLERLKLQWCFEITDNGLMSIVTHCSNLSYLDLLGAFRISGEDAFPILPKYLKKLRFLNLEQCNNIIDDVMLQLVEDMPQLQVINYYGDVLTQLGETF